MSKNQGRRRISHLRKRPSSFASEYLAKRDSILKRVTAKISIELNDDPTVSEDSECKKIKKEILKENEEFKKKMNLIGIPLEGKENQFAHMNLVSNTEEMVELASMLFSFIYNGPITTEPCEVAEKQMPPKICETAEIGHKST